MSLDFGRYALYKSIKTENNFYSNSLKLIEKGNNIIFNLLIQGGLIYLLAILCSPSTRVYIVLNILITNIENRINEIDEHM